MPDEPITLKRVAECFVTLTMIVPPFLYLVWLIAQFL